MIPYLPLAKLASHKQQLLSRLCELISQQQTQMGEFLPPVSSHFADQRPFPVDDFIVGKRQNKVLTECIEHPEIQLVMVIATMQRIATKVAQGVMHPPHIPLESEAQPPDVGRTRDHRPGRRLLGDSECI